MFSFLKCAQTRLRYLRISKIFPGDNYPLEGWRGRGKEGMEERKGRRKRFGSSIVFDRHVIRGRRGREGEERIWKGVFKNVHNFMSVTLIIIPINTFTKNHILCNKNTVKLAYSKVGTHIFPGSLLQRRKRKGGERWVGGLTERTPLFY